MGTTLIHGGLVIDGTGAAPRRGDVLVVDGVVERIGAHLDAPEGAERIDATGCWVTPGFIDLHTHYDAELELDPSLSESVRHGVTTVLVGSCGLSFAAGDPEDLADMFCRVEGVPREEVLPLLERIQDWDSPRGYLEHLDRRPLGPNVASFLGHSAVRAKVMGLGRSLDSSVEPTPAELDAMAAMLESALDDGYLGLSINTLPWDKMDGDRFRSLPTPSVFATWKEYRFLGEVLRRRDAVFQGVPDISGRWNLVLFAAIASGIRRKPLKTSIISMMDVQSSPGTHRVLGALTTFARRCCRADVRLQSLPQPFRLWTDGLENPVIEEFGAGTEALHLAAAARPELLRDPGYRARFAKQWTNRLKGRAYHRDLSEARIDHCPDPTLTGLSFTEVAERRGVDPVDAFLDLQAEYGNELRWTTTVGNRREDSVAWIVAHPQAQIGFSDAGAHLRNMAFYNFPLHLLRLVQRRAGTDRPVMSLGRAVHRVTGELAEYLDIDAGVLRVGGRADVVVVDPAGLDDELDTVVEAPMPGVPSLLRLVNRNDRAVRAVLVNGRLAWDGTAVAPGFGTDAGFGSVLRRRAADVRAAVGSSAVRPSAV
jgi:N-acyl-D-aspartate/D-glutamate deacylase